MNKQEKQELQKWFKEALDTINKKLHVVKELEERFHVMVDERINSITKDSFVLVSTKDIEEIRDRCGSAELTAEGAREILTQAMKVKDVVRNQERFNNLIESFGNAENAQDVLNELRYNALFFNTLRSVEKRLETLEKNNQKKWYQFWR